MPRAPLTYPIKGIEGAWVQDTKRIVSDNRVTIWRVTIWRITLKISFVVISLPDAFAFGLTTGTPAYS